MTHRRLLFGCSLSQAGNGLPRCHGLLSARIVDRYGGITGSGPLPPAPWQYRSHGLRPADLPVQACATSTLPLGRIVYHNGLPPAGPVSLDAGRSGATGVSKRPLPPHGLGISPRLVRMLYVDEELGLDLTNTGLRPGLDDHRSAARRSRSFRGAALLPHHQGGGEDAHAVASPTCGARTSPFRVLSTSRMALHDVPLDMLLPEAGATSGLRRGSWLRRLCPPLCVAPSRGLLRHAGQVEHRCSSRLFGADGSLDRHHLRRDLCRLLPGRLLHPSGLPSTCSRKPAHPSFKDPDS